MVFISYATKDEHRIKDFRSALDRDKISYWIDRDGMLPGDEVPKELRTAISACDCCVFVVTKQSVASKWCLVETAAFWGAGKRVIPYLLEHVKPTDFPGHLREVSGSDNSDFIRTAIRAVADDDGARGRVFGPDLAAVSHAFDLAAESYPKHRGFLASVVRMNLQSIARSLGDGRFRIRSDTAEGPSLSAALQSLLDTIDLQNPCIAYATVRTEMDSFWFSPSTGRAYFDFNIGLLRRGISVRRIVFVSDRYAVGDYRFAVLQAVHESLAKAFPHLRVEITFVLERVLGDEDILRDFLVVWDSQAQLPIVGLDFALASDNSSDFESFEIALRPTGGNTEANFERCLRQAEKKGAILRVEERSNLLLRGGIEASIRHLEENSRTFRHDFTYRYFEADADPKTVARMWAQLKDSIVRPPDRNVAAIRDALPPAGAGPGRWALVLGCTPELVCALFDSGYRPVCMDVIGVAFEAMAEVAVMERGGQAAEAFRGTRSLRGNWISMTSLDLRGLLEDATFMGFDVVVGADTINMLPYALWPKYFDQVAAVLAPDGVLVQQHVEMLGTAGAGPVAGWWEQEISACGLIPAPSPRAVATQFSGFLVKHMRRPVYVRAEAKPFFDRYQMANAFEGCNSFLHPAAADDVHKAAKYRFPSVVEIGVPTDASSNAYTAAFRIFKYSKQFSRTWDKLTERKDQPAEPSQ